MFVLFIITLIVTVVQLVKESTTKTIPAEYWSNMDLYFEDMNNGVSIEQRMKNLENGKYKITKEYKG